MTLNTYVIFIPLCLFISPFYSQSDAVSISSASRIIPIQLTPTPKPMLHLGGMQGENDVRLFSGLQFQPTKNLLIGGVLSPQNIEADLSLYYHVAIGYIPQWKFLNITSNMFLIGLHRNRFGSSGDQRWSSFSFMESAQFGSLKLNICWNHLFNQDWDRDTIRISTDLILKSNLYLSPGVLIYFTPNLDYYPFFYLSINL